MYSSTMHHDYVIETVDLIQDEVGIILSIVQKQKKLIR